MPVAGFEIRVVVLLVRHEAHRVDEAQRVVEIGEAEILGDRAAVGGQRPAGQGVEQGARLRFAQRVLAALARLAGLTGEFGEGHGMRLCGGVARSVVGRQAKVKAGAARYHDGMIEISERAQQHFRRLLARQQVEGLAIRLRVTDPGTARADCALEFVEPQELSGEEWTLECEGFLFHLDGAAVPWLEGADVDFEPNATGGQLNIRAPRIKGDMPDGEAGMIARVRYVLEAEINPRLAAHGGRVSLLEVDADGVVVLAFGGGCHGCGMVDVTLKQGIEKTLRERVPEIAGVRDATDHANADAPYYASKQGRSALG